MGATKPEGAVPVTAQQGHPYIAPGPPGPAQGVPMGPPQMGPPSPMPPGPVPPQPGQVIVGYEVYKHEAGCCKCEGMTQGGLIAIIILMVTFAGPSGRQDAYVAEAALLVRIDTPSASRQQQPLPTLGDSDTEDLLAAHCWAPGTGRSMFVDEGTARPSSGRPDGPSANGSCPDGPSADGPSPDGSSPDGPSPDGPSLSHAARVPPQPGQVIVSYEVYKHEILFWPLAWIPCVMPDCFESYQVPVYGYPQQPTAAPQHMQGPPTGAPVYPMGVV
ncbi:hypothetical protein N2152v2_005465 [Parachlorella kessleri]